MARLSSILLSLVALAPAALATPLVAGDKIASAPLAKRTEDPAVAARKKLHLGTAIGGALDLPTTVGGHSKVPSATEPPSKAKILDAWAAELTVTLVNSHGDDISTIHVNGAGPTPIGNPGAGRLANGQSATFTVQAGWNGNVAINDAQWSDTTGDESLIEGSFTDQGNGIAQGDINVSYVNGFSAAIVCSCNENGITVGCNKNLDQLNPCPAGDWNGQNSCRNPLRPDLTASQPTDFFRPCFGLGGPYTFPNDSNANQLNQKCPSENYTCCVGAACAPNPNQANW